MRDWKSLGNVTSTRKPRRGQASLNELSVLLLCVACGCAKPVELMKLDDGDLTVKDDASTDTGGTTDATVVQMTGGSSTGGSLSSGGASDTGGTSDTMDASTSDASDMDSATGTDNCGANRCFGYAPSNVDVTTLDLSSPGNATLDCGTTEITSSGGNVTFTNWCGTMPTPVVVSQSMGPDVAVIPVANLTIAAGNTLRLTGEMPVVLVAAGDMDISGTIDASSSDMSSGAGANWMCGTSTGGDGAPDSGSSSGGGGGGFGTAGGAGGDGNNVSGGTPGSSRTQVDPLSPLVGGCAGGIGAYDSSCNPNGGAGGGVVQLAASGTITVSGEINVAGADGNQGCGSDGGGGGGGSGGGVLIEGEDVDLTGATITADGGNGGRAGNNGGAGSTDPASPGVNGRNDGALGGSGGGGGYGRIQATAQGTCTACP